jgi:hypothetical protein
MAGPSAELPAAVGAMLAGLAGFLALVVIDALRNRAVGEHVPVVARRVPVWAMVVQAALLAAHGGRLVTVELQERFDLLVASGQVSARAAQAAGGILVLLKHARQRPDDRYELSGAIQAVRAASPAVPVLVDDNYAALKALVMAPMAFATQAPAVIAFAQAAPELAQRAVRINPMRAGADTVLRILGQAVRVAEGRR